MSLAGHHIKWHWIAAIVISAPWLSVEVKAEHSGYSSYVGYTSVFAIINPEYTFRADPYDLGLLHFNDVTASGSNSLIMFSDKQYLPPVLEIMSSLTPLSLSPENSTETISYFHVPRFDLWLPNGPAELLATFPNREQIISRWIPVSSVPPPPIQYPSYAIEDLAIEGDYDDLIFRAAGSSGFPESSADLNNARLNLLISMNPGFFTEYQNLNSSAPEPTVTVPALLAGGLLLLNRRRMRLIRETLDPTPWAVS